MDEEQDMVKKIRNNYRALEKGMNPIEMSGILYERDVITWDEKEEVCLETKTARAKNECLIGILLRQSEDKLQKFHEALEEVSPHLAGILDLTIHNMDKQNQKANDCNQSADSKHQKMEQRTSSIEQQTSELKHETSELRDQTSSLEHKLQKMEKHFSSKLEEAHQKADKLHKDVDQKVEQLLPTNAQQQEQQLPQSDRQEGVKRNLKRKHSGDSSQSGINAYDADGESQLTRAAWEGDFLKVQHLINTNGIDVNLPSSDEHTPLMLAAERGHCEIVSSLMQCPDIDINARTSNGWTALMAAAYENEVNAINIITQKEAGAKIKFTTSNGHNAFMWACRNGSLDAAKAIYELDESFLELTDFQGRTALLLASLNGHSNTVAYLIKIKADINHIDTTENRNSALILASERGHLEVVKILISAGADTEYVDTRGNTALDWAKMKTHNDIVAFLGQ